MNFMIDIETLDTKSSAVILTVGIVPFDHAMVFDNKAKEFFLNTGEQMSKLNRTVNPSTLSWWMRQPDEVRCPMFAVNQKTPLSETLDSIDRFFFAECEDYYNNEEFDDPEAIKIWSNGPSFDIKILENLYESMGRSMPYHYRSPRCQRTIEGILGKDVPRRESDPTRLHNAKHDAIDQARRVIELVSHFPNITI